MNLAKQARKLNPPLQSKISKDDNPNEEKAAQKALKHFVTDPKGAIYAIRPAVPELLSGLLKARYSRTELSAKQLLWREFVSNKTNIPWKTILAGVEALDQTFNFKRAAGVAERILLQYGDDSVFELSGAHLFIDQVSMIGAKVIEDARIGISPLEKSTRYVIFDQKNNDGDYSFFKEPQLINSKYQDLYLKTSRDCFNFYTQAVAALMDYFRKQMPIEKQIEDFAKLTDEKAIKSAKTAYEFSIRAKACDVARGILPASTLTNVGLFGNARAFGYLFTKMEAMNLAESQMIGQESVRELKKVLPKFFDVVNNDHGQKYQDYLKKTDQFMKKRAVKLLKNIQPDPSDRVTLAKLDPDPEVNIAAALLYPYSNLPLKQLIKIMKQLGGNACQQLLKDSLKFRTNRRHKPPRAFEIAGYELIFDCLADFGSFRDLHRHRMLTQQHQAYTPEHGYLLPTEFSKVGLDGEYAQLMAGVKAAHDQVFKDFPDQSQYLTTLAHSTRWYMGMGLREVFWLTELRSTPQGHMSYRSIAQEMYQKAKQVYPFLEELTKEQFVNMSDRSTNLERLEAMQKIQAKLSKLNDS